MYDLKNLRSKKFDNRACRVWLRGIPT